MWVGTTSQAFGGMYVLATAEDSGTATWTFTVPSSGGYYVWSRVMAVDPEHD
jgi:hypothetical protein